MCNVLQLKNYCFIFLAHPVTLHLLVPSADNLCKQLGPRPDVWSNLGPNCLTLISYFLSYFLKHGKYFLKKVNFEKKSDDKILCKIYSKLRVKQDVIQ